MPISLTRLPTKEELPPQTCRAKATMCRSDGGRNRAAVAMQAVACVQVVTHDEDAKVGVGHCSVTATTDGDSGNGNRVTSSLRESAAVFPLVCWPITVENEDLRRTNRQPWLVGTYSHSAPPFASTPPRPQMVWSSIIPLSRQIDGPLNHGETAYAALRRQIRISDCLRRKASVLAISRSLKSGELAKPQSFDTESSPSGARDVDSHGFSSRTYRQCRLTEDSCIHSTAR